MNAATPRLEGSIRKYLAPILREDGFSGSGRCFRRSVGGFIHIVQVWGWRHGGEFTINIGIHPSALPDVLGNRVNLKKITVPDCEFSRVLTETGVDQHWKYDRSTESMDAAVREATTVYLRAGRNMFSGFAGPNSPLCTVTPAQFDAGQFDFGGFEPPKVRTARNLALMRRASGDVESARAFAAIALASLGSATDLREELEELAR